MNNNFVRGEMMSDSVFLFYKPDIPVKLEVVFIHGLEHGNCDDAYWKTWLARDEGPNNVWPTTWIREHIPCAQIFALKYDGSTKQTATTGRMDLYNLGEKLVQELVMLVNIGQSGVPVVFVCHGFGGLVAKQIVVSGRHHFSKKKKIQQFLENVVAFCFYSTPHHGSQLAKSPLYHDEGKDGIKGPLLDIFEVLNIKASRLNYEFDQAKDSSWHFHVAAEAHETIQYGQMVVPEVSSRATNATYIVLDENYTNIVRPKSKQDSSFKWLIMHLEEVLARNTLPLPVERLLVESLVRSEEQEKHIREMLLVFPIVGLIGMGGSGKSTMAKVISKFISKDYERSCYLDNVRSKGSVDEVTKMLLQQLGIIRNEFQELRASHLRKLKAVIKQRKVLVVVDDLGSGEDFRHILEDMDFLNGHVGSRMIVTCRERQQLKNHTPQVEMHDMVLLNMSGQGLELFSSHAFKGARTEDMRRQALEKYFSKHVCEGNLMIDILSACKDIVEACNGLPLSLEVMGSYLGGFIEDKDTTPRKCLEICRKALVALKRADFINGANENEKLWTKLRLSYDVLCGGLKEKFLDIACFFCGSVKYNEATLMRIWGGEDEALLDLENLKERSLVIIDKENGLVTMHDQLRDLGQRIAVDEGKDVKHMSRVWKYEDVEKLLKRGSKRGSKRIKSKCMQGLSMNDWDNYKKSSMESMEINCPKLRLFDLHSIEYDIIETIEVPSSIRWLCLCESKIIKMPTFVQKCENLHVLDMRGCTFLEELHDNIGDLGTLFQLDLSHCCKLAKLPESIGMLSKLSQLDLSYCKNLESLPDSIGKLENLSQLHLRDCLELTHLPYSIDNLGNLCILDVWGCVKLTRLPYKGLTSLHDSYRGLVKVSRLDHSHREYLTSIPESINKMVGLSVLDLRYFKELTRLPDSIGELVKVSELDLTGCEGLTSLPWSIGKMVDLSELDLGYCKGLTSLPWSIGELVKVSKLNFSYCEGLTSLPWSIGEMVNLLELDLGYCKGLTSLPDSIEKLVKVSKLNISYCEGLTFLPESIGKMVGLSVLDLRYCKGLTILPDSIGELVKVSELGLTGCEGLTSLPWTIGEMVDLSELDLGYCKGLTSLPWSIRELVKVSKLNFSYCEDLISLPWSIGEMVDLLELDLGYCKGLTSLPDSIGELVKISKLKISYCEGLTSLPESIGKMVGLSMLDLEYCKGLTSLPDSIGELVKVSELGLTGCEGLTSLPWTIGEMVDLLELDLGYCKGLISLPWSIRELVKVSKLNISYCEGLTSLPWSIGEMVDLLELDLGYCKGLTSLPWSIRELVKVSKLNFSYCEGLTSLPWSIGEMVNLLELDLGYCRGLISLPDSIGELVKVSKLNISYCEGLTFLPESIGKMVGLSELDLGYCKGLTSLPDSIVELVKVSKLNISYCEGLTSLPEFIGKMVGLSVLDLRYCVGLTRLPNSIGKLVKVSEFGLIGCEGLTSLPWPIGQMVDLSELDLGYCKGLTSLPDSIGELVNVSKLNISYCEGLTFLPESIGKMVGLSVLDLRFCTALTSLPDYISNLSQLSCLDLQGCLNLEWMKPNQILVLHMLKQLGCSIIVLPDGRLYHGKYSSKY